MTHSERFQVALERPDPALGLRSVVLELDAEGCQKPDIRDALERLLVDLRTRPDYREADEDAVLDVLDGLAGGCHFDAEASQ